MDYAVEIYKLSNKFYTDYPETQYPELMQKDNRPYTCLLIETKDEYVATIANIERIVGEVNEYVDKYINHIRQTAVLHTREFERRYQYSTLQYFHDILDLDN